ncbi:MAG: TolC family protein [Alphaproteobacteria bacterium]|nr:TolC family protein [Alphaproteobacteria bacterium]
MKKILILSSLLLIIFTPYSYGRNLSFNEAINMILTESNDLKKADANVKKVQAQLDAVKSKRWFHVEGSATYINLINVKDPGNPNGVELPPELGGLISSISGTSSNIVIPDNLMLAGVTITQPIYTFGKIGNAVNAMDSAVQMSISGKELVNREVRYGAAQLYWTAKMAEEAVKIAEKSLNASLTARKKLTSAGRASRSNLVKIEADIAVKEINLSDAKFNRDTAHRMLKIMAGIDVNEELVLTDNFPSKFDELNVKTMNSNPEWDMLQHQVQMSEQNASAKRAGYLPTLAATASYNYVVSNEDYKLWNGNKAQNAYWGLSLSVPIFDAGLNRAQATVAAMDAEIAREDLDKSKKLKSEEYQIAVKKYEHLRTNLFDLEKARNLAEKAYGYSRDRFAAGQTSAVELAEVSSALSQADMAVLNAKYNLVISQEQIKKLNK